MRADRALQRVVGSPVIGRSKPVGQGVAKAIYLADGGNLTFTGHSDRDTAHSWEEVDLDPHALQSLAWSDFEMVDAGSRFEWTGDCERKPITD